MGRYVGIDPSTKTGLVILDEDGTILLQKEISSELNDDPQRFIDVAHTVDSYVTMFDKIMIEGFSFGSKGRGVSTQYGFGWIIRSTLLQNNCSYTEVTPTALKKFATGTGTIKKENMILPIFKKWGFENDSDNIRDAYVLAMIGRYLDGLEEPTKYQADVLKAVRK